MKKLLNLSLILWLGLTASVYSYTLPFIENNPDNLNTKKIIAKNVSFMRYAKGDTLDLSYGKLEDKDMPAIIDFLKNHPNITSLNLQGNSELTAAGLVPLASINTLISLNLARSYKLCPNGVCTGGLEAKDVIPFANNKTLKVLNLDGHSIGDEGALALAKNNYLEELDLEINDITDAGGVALAQHPTLKILSLWANDQVGLKTADMLAKNTILKEINLKQTSIPDQGAIALAGNTHLTYLDLSLTNVTEKGAAAFANNQTLQKLEIWGNSIKASGAIALADNKTLLSLDLSGNDFDRSAPRFGDEGAAAFGHNKTLQELRLNDQNISLSGAAEVIKNPNLKTLWLDGNRKLGDDGAIFISQHAEQLTELALIGCKLTDKGAKAAASMKNIERLFLSLNFISDEGAESLANNTSLKHLELIINEIHDAGALALAQNQTLDTLYVPLNRITFIGNQALKNNAYFRDLMIGGENPFPPPHVNLNDKKSNFAASLMKKGYCYRTTNRIHCLSAA